MRREEVERLLSSYGYSFDEFEVFMNGQTVGINEDGSTNFYVWDVEKFTQMKGRENYK